MCRIVGRRKKGEQEKAPDVDDPDEDGDDNSDVQF